MIWSPTNDKHNEANGEDNKDGANDNHSCNYGVEGPTDDPGHRSRCGERQKRNFLFTLLLFARRADDHPRAMRSAARNGGNNNAYCQDNEISWLNWDLDQAKKELMEFTTQLIAFRQKHPNLHRRKFFQDRAISPETVEKQQVDGDGGARHRLVPAGRTGDDRG